MRGKELNKFFPPKQKRRPLPFLLSLSFFYVNMQTEPIIVDQMQQYKSCFSARYVKHMETKIWQTVTSVSAPDMFFVILLLSRIHKTNCNPTISWHCLFNLIFPFWREVYTCSLKKWKYVIVPGIFVISVAVWLWKENICNRTFHRRNVIILLDICFSVKKKDVLIW